MYLGIDVGTSGVKVLLMDDRQQVKGSATAELDVARPHPGWSEQNPDDWVAATRAALTRLRATHGFEAVAGIGLSGQMHGAVVLDDADRPLRPAILWNDSRSQAEAEALDANPLFRQISGNIVFPGFTAPKLVWMARHEPDLFARIRKVLLPKDYIRLWLTGTHATDLSDAAGTSWLDTGARLWSDALLEASGMTRDHMPHLVEGSAVSGGLRAAVAQEFGMPVGIPVAGGGGDNAVTAVGAGTVSVGDGFVSLGTSGVVFAATDRYLPRPESAVHAFCHCLPGMWHQMGVVLSAASALGWLSGLVGQKPDVLTQALGTRLIAPGEVTFLPYLSGERTPHNDPMARAAFLGCSASTTREALTQAVIEGVAFAFADSLAALRAAGSDPQSLLALGGGARSDYWLRAIATALDVPILRPKSGDFGAAFGAARLGLIVASGAQVTDICTRPEIADEILPEKGLLAAYGDKLANYRDAYKKLRAT